MLHHKLKAGEVPGTYLVTAPITDEELMTIANQIARTRLATGEAVTSKDAARQALQTLLQDREHEVFAALFLDNQHRVLSFEELFRGTLDSASVYPREVVKRALAVNAAALLIVHNHPSGNPEPSRADIQLTLHLREALALVEIRILDHLVVGAEGVVSLAERGHL
ncbi:RadC family protein [Aeromonas salmonicida]|uniref:RadC family protein n=1 Tax=Aeromonas salmonicida TaxID=645 RepID=UPI000F78BA40|nr:DNA repair protein RadC [Aeromonas salmonicida]RSM24564.1 DNA repair protein RadC [Aeromonas salmonicida]